MTLLGLLWAMLAPALLVLPIVAIARGLKVWRPVWPARARWLVALSLTVATVLALWLPERLQFDRLCDGLGAPRVLEKRRVDGFFLDDSTANSFGTRYLHDEGFVWYEARSIYTRGAYTRYRKTGKGIETEEVGQLSATVTVASRHETAGPYVSVQRLVISDRSSERVLASAAQAHFNGGPAMPVLGAYGSASCPSPITAEGSRRFDDFYHLAKATLR